MSNIKNTIAKLTPNGKKKLFEKGVNNLITKFCLGDSDANYNTSESLSENIFDVSGSENTTFNNITIRKTLFKDAYNIYKIFNDADKYVIEEKNETEFKLTETLKPILVNRDEDNENLNLLMSIGAPITEEDMSKYTNGIYTSNAYNSFLSDEYMIYSFSNTGEILAGDDMKIILNGIEIYSSLPKGIQTPDKSIFDDTNLALNINTNMVCLFSDDIQKPLEGGSWSDGHGLKNPYANGKKLFNLFATNDLKFGDNMVGYVLLDKGVLVLFNKDLISKINTSEEHTLEIETTKITNYLAYEVVCNINRNEFSSTTNNTHNNGYGIRVSEIGLYDDDNDLIAIAKVNKHIILDKLQPISISVSISI